jgi:hypothetical protein
MARFPGALFVGLALAASVGADPVLPLPGSVAPLLTTVDNPANHTVAPPSFFDGVAILSLGGKGCSGSLIAGTSLVLTAAHCVSDDYGNIISASSASAGFDSMSGHQQFGALSISVAPGWNGDFESGYDLALIRLSGVPTVAGYSLYLGDYTGGTVVLAGYGVSGYGATGIDRDAYPFGTLRWGTNSYEVVWDIPGYPWGFDFDDGVHNTFGTLGTGTNEVLIVPGDSGGPTFYNGRIIGVHSFYGRMGTCCDIDGIINGTFGEIGGDTRVAAYADWLNTQIPEPGPAALAGLGLAVLLAAARLRRAVGQAPSDRSRRPGPACRAK